MPPVIGLAAVVLIAVLLAVAVILHHRGDIPGRAPDRGNQAEEPWPYDESP